METAQPETDNFQYKYDILLRFLSKEGQQGYIFAMADDQRYIAQINTNLTKDLKARGIETGLLFLNPESDEPLFYQIKQAAVGKNTLIVANLYTLIRANAKGTDLLVELNFARESLWELGLPILFWTDKQTLNLIANHAPDLFSQRRMGTVHFTEIMDDHLKDQITGPDRDAFIRTENFEQLEAETHLLEKRLESAKQSNYPTARITEEIALPLAHNYALMGIKDSALALLNKYSTVLDTLNNDNIIEKRAEIFDHLGDNDSAINILDQRIILLNKQIGETPNNIKTLSALARFNITIADYYYKLGNTYKCLSHYNESNQYYYQLLILDAENSHFKNGLAISYSKLGGVYEKMGDFNKALEFYTEQTRLFEQLHDANPRDVAFKNGLAISYSKLGGVYEKMGDFNKALGFYTEQTGLFDQLHDANPRDVAFKNGLAISYLKLGSINEAQSEKEQALNQYQKAQKLWQELSVDAPGFVDYKKNLDFIDDLIKKLSA